MKLRLSFAGIIAVCCIIIFISISSLFYFGRYGNTGPEAKIILIGLDGATWDVILPLVKQGKLPNIAKIMRHGAWGSLKSLKRMESPMCWMSIATGKIPEKHGIGIEAYSYLEDRNSIKTNTVWDILERDGKRIGLLNWLLTWPPREINGFVIPGWTAQNKETYPREIFKNVTLDIPRHELESISPSFRLFSEESAEFFYLKKRFNPDFFAVAFYSTDEIQHLYWKYMQPEFFKGVSREEIKKFGNLIFRIYEDFDGFLGKVLKTAGRDTVVIIVSDHGFGPRIQNDTETFSSFDMKYFLTTLGLQKNDEFDTIDMSRSIVYSGRLLDKNKTHVLININAKNDSGIITGHDYNKAKGQVIKLIEGIKIKGSGKKILRFTKEDEKGRIFFEIINQNIPEDACIEAAGRELFLKDFMLKGGIPGNHRPDGIVLLFGKLIGQGKEIKDASVLDITPTILYLSGLPVGKDMDGRVLMEAVNRDYIKHHPVKYVLSYDGILNNNVMEASSRSPADNTDADLIKRLKRLGYLQ